MESSRARDRASCISIGVCVFHGIPVHLLLVTVRDSSLPRQAPTHAGASVANESSIHVRIREVWDPLADCSLLLGMCHLPSSTLQVMASASPNLSPMPGTLELASRLRSACMRNSDLGSGFKVFTKSLIVRDPPPR